MTKYFDSYAEKFHPIPEAGWYVLSNDTFMSGWSYAKGKINTCVVPCKDFEQANRVREYVMSRSDQKHVRIVRNKPRSKPGVLYSLLEDWKENV